MDQEELIPHLFRSEFRKITAVLCKAFGIEHISLAEDIAGETFLSALETWPYRGIPENPVAWLYAVAKNKARNQLIRQKTFKEKVIPQIKPGSEIEPGPELDLSEKNISDSQLQMLFTICHPSIPVEAQIGLALRILCGFGIEEIAHAFLTNKETINKRLFRAREKLRQENIAIEYPGIREIEARLEAVLTTLYLLFNEGYYSESQDNILREDFCLESMRLTRLLIDFEMSDLPEVNALLSLMCFHASRFPARKDANGEIILYDDQDESLWDQELIRQGVYYLHRSARGEQISKYHLEAHIAYWHTIKTDSHEKWENILQLYNQLLQISYSPIAALNRTYALARSNGPAEAIREAEKLDLRDNHFYYFLLGELYSGIDKNKSMEYLEKAKNLAHTQTDKNTILKKMETLG